MKNISDIIEDFILEQFLEGNEVSLSRNDLASFFNCAPSQINYVLSTRFTSVRGFDIESKRGGGGFIRVQKIVYDDKNLFIDSLIKKYVGKKLDYNMATHLLDNLKSSFYITPREYNIIKVAISDKALAGPVNVKSITRASIMNGLLLELMKNNFEENENDL